MISAEKTMPREDLLKHAMLLFSPNSITVKYKKQGNGYGSQLAVDKVAGDKSKVTGIRKTETWSDQESGLHIVALRNINAFRRPDCSRSLPLWSQQRVTGGHHRLW